MKIFNYKLATSILKSTNAYELGHINMEVKKDRIKVWSMNNGMINRAFHSTNIIQLFPSCFHTFLDYNEIENRVELHIF